MLFFINKVSHSLIKSAAIMGLLASMPQSLLASMSLAHPSSGAHHFMNAGSSHNSNSQNLSDPGNYTPTDRVRENPFSNLEEQNYNSTLKYLRNFLDQNVRGDLRCHNDQEFQVMCEVFFYTLRELGFNNLKSAGDMLNEISGELDDVGGNVINIINNLDTLAKKEALDFLGWAYDAYKKRYSSSYYVDDVQFNANRDSREQPDISLPCDIIMSNIGSEIQDLKNKIKNDSTSKSKEIKQYIRSFNEKIEDFGPVEKIKTYAALYNNVLADIRGLWEDDSEVYQCNAKFQDNATTQNIHVLDDFLDGTLGVFINLLNQELGLSDTRYIDDYVVDRMQNSSGALQLSACRLQQIFNKKDGPETYGSVKEQINKLKPLSNIAALCARIDDTDTVKVLFDVSMQDNITTEGGCIPGYINRMVQVICSYISKNSFGSDVERAKIRELSRVPLNKASTEVVLQPIDMVIGRLNWAENKDYNIKDVFNSATDDGDLKKVCSDLGLGDISYLTVQEVLNLITTKKIEIEQLGRGMKENPRTDQMSRYRTNNLPASSKKTVLGYLSKAQDESLRDYYPSEDRIPDLPPPPNNPNKVRTNFSKQKAIVKKFHKNAYMEELQEANRLRELRRLSKKNSLSSAFVANDFLASEEAYGSKMMVNDDIDSAINTLYQKLSIGVEKSEFRAGLLASFDILQTFGFDDITNVDILAYVPDSILNFSTNLNDYKELLQQAYLLYVGNKNSYE